MNQGPKTIKEDEGSNRGAVSTTVHTENEPPALIRYEDQNFVDTTKAVWNYSLLYDDDIITFQNGTNYQLYNKFGSKRRSEERRVGKEGRSGRAREHEIRKETKIER